MDTVDLQLADLAVSIVRFVEDYQPGIVACEFADAESRCHTFIGKLPYFTAEPLDASSRYPQSGAAQCLILDQWCDAEGRELVRISTDVDCYIESVEGLTEFVVLRKQITVLTDRAV